jgi:cysteine synthase A
VKDRMAKHIIMTALKEGTLKPGGTIYEGTVGSTGISLSMIARSQGMKSTIVMPDDQAEEKTQILKLYGAEVIHKK